MLYDSDVPEHITYYRRLQLFDYPIKEGQRKGGTIVVRDSREATMTAKVLDVEIVPGPDSSSPDHCNLVYRIEPTSRTGSKIPDILRSDGSPDTLTHSMYMLSEFDDLAVEDRDRVIAYHVGQTGVSEGVTVQYYPPQCIK